MKYLFFFFCCLIVGSPCKAYLYESYLDQEEPPKSKAQGKLVSKTKDALLSIDYIEDRANYFVFKLKNLTFGDYSDEVMYLAPIVTGNLEFKVQGVNFYYDHFSEKSGFQYKIKF